LAESSVVHFLRGGEAGREESLLGAERSAAEERGSTVIDIVCYRGVVPGL